MKIEIIIPEASPAKMPKPPITGIKPLWILLDVGIEPILNRIAIFFVIAVATKEVIIEMM
jgi:hypothetical protein